MESGHFTVESYYLSLLLHLSLSFHDGLCSRCTSFLFKIRPHLFNFYVSLYQSRVFHLPLYSIMHLQRSVIEYVLSPNPKVIPLYAFSGGSNSKLKLLMESQAHIDVIYCQRLGPRSVSNSTSLELQISNHLQAVRHPLSLRAYPV